jgi:hypothetical protein
MPTWLGRRPRRLWLLFLVFTGLWYIALVLGNCLATPHHAAEQPQPPPVDDAGAAGAAL